MELFTSIKKNKPLICVFLFFFIIFFILQFRVPEIIGYDGYLHIKVADLTKQGLVKDFPWTTESIIKDNYSDHQFLFRIMLIPFTFFGLMVGAKIASVLFSALSFCVFYWYLSKNNIKQPFLWTSLYFISSYFLIYRYLLGRPIPVVISLIILTIYFVEKRMYKSLLLISFLLNWLSPSFIFQLGIIGLYFLIDYFASKKFDFKLIAYPLIGLVAAILLNPYFPRNIYMLYIQLVKVNLLGNLYNQEWRAWPIGELFIFNCIFFSFLLLSIAVNIKKSVLTRKKAFFFILTVVFLIFMVKSRRMQEFFAPFAVLFSCFSLDEYLNKKNIKLLFMIFLIAVAPFSLMKLDKYIKGNHFLPWYKDGALWTKQNIPDGSKIFINGYTFSYLFFYDSDVYYTHGVDLTYSYLYDPDKFNRYMKVLKGEKVGYDIIKYDYNPDYLFIGKIEQDVNLFNFIVQHKENYKIVYEDNSTGILKLKK